jgi:hypothetical protein
MGRARRADDDSATSPSVQEIQFVMTSPFTAPQARFPVRRLTQHEIVVARLAVAHDNGAHDSPLLACFKCLHGEPPALFSLRKAA